MDMSVHAILKLTGHRISKAQSLFRLQLKL